MESNLTKYFNLNMPRSDWNGASLFYVGMISLSLFGLDYITGPVIQEPYIYVILVIITAWFFGPTSAYIFSALLPLFRIVLYPFWTLPWPLHEAFVNVVIQIVTLVIVAYLITRIRELVTEVRALKGKLPICIRCKKIRNQHDKWEDVEAYISRQSEMKFVYGICPDCEEKHSEEFSVEQREQVDRM